MFKFTAKKKARYFNEDDTCYITMQSMSGCTLRMTAMSSKIRAMAEPEKIKEFNKALTKAELAASEYQAKKRE